MQAAPVSAIAKGLGLTGGGGGGYSMASEGKNTSRTFQVQACCANTGDGLEEGMKWAVDIFAKNRQG